MAFGAMPFRGALAGILLCLATTAAAADPAVRSALAHAPYERIISLYSAHTENLLNLGAADQLIGVDAQAADLPGAGGKATFSYRDDPERFLAVRPDLVMIRPMIARGYPLLLRRLTSSGIQVVSLQPTTADQLPAYWRLLGRLSGREASAEAMLQRFSNAVIQFKRLSAQVVQPKRVYFEAIHSKMKTFAPEAMAIFALETAGGINVAADAPVRRNNNIAVYGKERLLSHADQIDVFLSQQGAMNRASVEMIMAEPGFSVIKAVKSGEVYLIEEAMVSRPTPALLRGISRIGCLLYPELYCEAGGAILRSAGMQ